MFTKYLDKFLGRFPRQNKEKSLYTSIFYIHNSQPSDNKEMVHQRIINACDTVQNRPGIFLYFDMRNTL